LRRLANGCPAGGVVSTVQRVDGGGATDGRVRYARTAILVVSDLIEPDDSAAGRGFRYALPPNERTVNLEQSLAVAIDRRGYFMTAYHCVEKGRKPIIVYRQNGKQRMATPRVVAELRKLDLAILAVDAPLSAAFEWAAPGSFTRGETLLSGGADKGDFAGDMLSVRQRCLGGVLTKTSPVSGGFAVEHNVPIRPGDSGGPTLDVEGRLVGINSRGTLRPFAATVSTSFRPPPELVSRLIEADCAK